MVRFGEQGRFNSKLLELKWLRRDGVEDDEGGANDEGPPPEIVSEHLFYVNQRVAGNNI